MRDDLGAREELRQRIVAKLAPGFETADIDQCVDGVMSLFYDVRDEWERAMTTTLAFNGEQWIDNRFLVCRVPVQGVTGQREIDRTVADA